MSEIVECPHCGARIDMGQQPRYDHTVTMTCPYCGSAFDYVPGFGALSGGSQQAPPTSFTRTEGSMPPSPQQRPRSPSSLRDPIFKEGRARPLPRDDAFGPAKPSKPFKPAEEFGRACGITLVLCLGLFLVLFMMMFFMAGPILF